MMAGFLIALVLWVPGNPSNNLLYIYRHRAEVPYFLTFNVILAKKLIFHHSVEKNYLIFDYLGSNRFEGTS